MFESNSCCFTHDRLDGGVSVLEAYKLCKSAHFKQIVQNLPWISFYCTSCRQKVWLGRVFFLRDKRNFLQNIQLVSVLLQNEPSPGCHSLSKLTFLLTWIQLYLSLPLLQCFITKLQTAVWLRIINDDMKYCNYGKIWHKKQIFARNEACIALFSNVSGWRGHLTLTPMCPTQKIWTR